MYSVLCKDHSSGWCLPSSGIQQSERRCELFQKPDSFWIWRNSRRPRWSALHGFPTGHMFTQSSCTLWGGKFSRTSRVSSSHLDVSSFFVLVLESCYTAVLFLQTGHRAFYGCDTRGRIYTIRDITSTEQENMVREKNLLRLNHNQKSLCKSY